MFDVGCWMSPLKSLAKHAVFQSAECREVSALSHARHLQKTILRYSAAWLSRNETLPLLHPMEERAGERRCLGDVILRSPSPRSSPHFSVGGSRTTTRA